MTTTTSAQGRATRSPVAATELVLGGMTCGSCASRVERVLNRLDGVQASVNYATQRASIAHDDSITVAELVATVERAGYTARTPRPPAAADDGDTRDDGRQDPAGLRERLVVCVALTVPVIVLSMVPALQFRYWQWAALGLTVPVVVWGALPIHRAAVANLRRGSASMDTLVSIGSVAALGWSLYAMVFGSAGGAGHTHLFAFTAAPTDGASQIYLEVAAGVTTFVLAGRHAEARARRRSEAALVALHAMAARDAAVLRDGHEVRLPVDEVMVGDRVVVRPGEKVPTDAVVAEGSSAVDTSMITGETRPVDVAAGDDVVGGSVNTSGRLVVRVTRTGADTQLAQMAALVEQAQIGKAGVQRLADRVSGMFVPVVIVLAALTWGFWSGVGAPAAVAFAAATAVLIVACPCALGLATPTALLVGTGRAAQLGILIAGPEALESTRRVDTVLLDKTGTVTTGEMSLTDIVVVDGESRDEVLGVAGALEAASQHPVAQAVVRHATERVGAFPDVQDAVAVDGLGIRGVVGGRDVVIGRAGLVLTEDATIPNAVAAALAEAQQRGSTAVVLAWSGRARAVLVVTDTVRPSSRAAVAELTRLGLHPVLLSGDNAGAVRAVADEVGIAEVVADALPADKVDLVRRLQDQGRVVAMVGDGVNDAAALAQADLGLAMGTGTDVAIHASDLTLVRADLSAAVDAVRLSRRTLAVIKGNMVWALGYNCAALPLAAAGMLNPMLAGAAMALSSVFVVTNSLRLRRFAPYVPSPR